MCGRYSVSLPKEKVSKRFNVEVPDQYHPRYNAAPTQELPVITDSASNEFSFFKWGMIPNWSMTDSVGINLINARAETVLTKSPFKQCIRIQRCLIPADGFYEWKKQGKNKVPYRITLSNDEAFCIAGTWDTWVDKAGEVTNSFTIITTEANELVREIHDRMPVILPKEIEREWLKPKLKDSEILELLRPYDSSKMSSYPTHKIVNSVNYDTPECLHVAPKIYPGESFSLFD